ncbi:hypothetical protein ACEN9F_22750 [Duganella sp. CT11-25]|uniref:hypothetical protein n=1 Tax=unclassified Duganella TaxID=2636909 RepID=UPI0039AEBA45
MIFDEGTIFCGRWSAERIKRWEIQRVSLVSKNVIARSYDAYGQLRSEQEYQPTNDAAVIDSWLTGLREKSGVCPELTQAMLRVLRLARSETVDPS